MSALKLSPNVARLPQVQEVLGALDRTRQRNRELRGEAKSALTPAASVLSTQAGAALHGVILAYGGRLTPQLVLGAGLLGVIGGAMLGDPRVIAAGNGMLAPVTAHKVFEALTQRTGG